MWHPHGVTTSDTFSADTQVWAMPGTLVSMAVTAPDSGTCTALVYDSENSTLTGKKLIAVIEVQSGENSNYDFGMCTVNRGIYVDLTGTLTGVVAVVKFMAG